MPVCQCWPSAAVTVLSPQLAAVYRHHWLSAGEFLDMFAISRAAPGPGSLIGVKAAGMAGGAPSPSPQCSRYPVWPCMVVARY
jgi:hypothetical protein